MRTGEKVRAPVKYFLVTDDPTMRAIVAEALGKERLVYIDEIPERVPTALPVLF